MKYVHLPYPWFPICLSVPSFISTSSASLLPPPSSRHSSSHTVPPDGTPISICFSKRKNLVEGKKFSWFFCSGAFIFLHFVWWIRNVCSAIIIICVCLSNAWLFFSFRSVATRARSLEWRASFSVFFLKFLTYFFKCLLRSSKLFGYCSLSKHLVFSKHTVAQCSRPTIKF